MLTPNRSKALPLFHALTGCDTVSSFANRGKKSAWSVWNSFPSFTTALLDLSRSPDSISDSTFKVLEQFVILLFDHTTDITDINEARQKLFLRKKGLENIPPTREAFSQHLKRAVYQGGYIWGQCLVPNPTSWGWKKDEDGQFVPLWSNLPDVWKSCKELVSCKCKKGCNRNCKCVKANLPCTGLCLCEWGCDEGIVYGCD